MERNPTQIRDQRQESVHRVCVERQWESDGHNPHLRTIFQEKLRLGFPPLSYYLQPR
ncbi:hypothetical protein CFP56_019373 [Quercus suber]|uniref:Uncharacterized protein n=1 Tax=Quercus suber TaxID=58331 RepID=A0AAW0KKS3_QUESU